MNVVRRWEEDGRLRVLIINILQKCYNLSFFDKIPGLWARASRGGEGGGGEDLSTCVEKKILPFNIIYVILQSFSI
jgi:hypothetical protein